MYCEVLTFSFQLFSMAKRLDDCCVYAVKPHSSHDGDDVHEKAFAVTPETGIVYVSQPRELYHRHGLNITIWLYVVVNASYDVDDMAMDGDTESESASLSSHWLSVANISVHILPVEADFNVTATSLDERKQHTTLLSTPRFEMHIQRVSKNVTNLIWNNFNKPEPISIIFCT